MSTNSSNHPSDDNVSKPPLTGGSSGASGSSSTTPGGMSSNVTPSNLSTLHHGQFIPVLPDCTPLRDANGREYDVWVLDIDPATGHDRWTGQFLRD